MSSVVVDVAGEVFPRVAVIGAGPAGLMAAESLACAGLAVDIYDAMPSPGRKFLLAGVGGMNLTHAEPLEAFLGRYGERRAAVAGWLAGFGPQALRDWAAGLGVETFVGSSGRVFPADMKAAPLLRAWLHRLKQAGARLHVRHRWLGWGEEGALRFATPAGEVSRQADAVVLALGGGSWPRLGSDAGWVPLLTARGVAIQPLLPANCGFTVAWSPFLRERFAGEPLKPVVAHWQDAGGERHALQGECVVTEHGIEGGVVYALSAMLRGQLAAAGEARLWLDLAPGRSQSSLASALAKPRGKESFTNLLRKRTGLSGVKAALLRECLPAEALADPARLAEGIKSLPLRLTGTRPLEEAISSAGGVALEALDDRLMLCNLPGVFCAGEMLDWEAPTGGYLLTACFASGRAAGQGAAAWLAEGGPSRSGFSRE